jgi:hypothetical protein
MKATKPIQSDAIAETVDTGLAALLELLTEKALARASGRFGVYIILDRGEIKGIRTTSEATILN